MERKKIAMILAEFLGTAILTAVFLAVIKSNLSYAYFISIGVGLALAVATLVFGAISGAHLNPAVTIGLWTARRINALSAVVYVAAQLLGGLSAYMLYRYLVNATGSMDNTGTYDARILVAEATGAFIFAMGWAATVYHKMDDGRRAFVIGASFTVGILVASFASPGLLNPAVALGLQSWVWGTYVLGPILGAVIGFNLYALLFAPASSLLGKDKK